MATVHGENVRVYTRRLCWLAGFVLAIAHAAGCGDACHHLAVHICQCGRTQIEQASCIQRVNTDTSAHVTPADKKVCEQLLDTCTCQALSEGNLEACGLSNE
jgi:hypothetical protein